MDSSINKLPNINRIIDEHLHSKQFVAPESGVPILVTSGVGAWNLGDFSDDILAEDIALLPFDIHWIDIIANDNDDYELVLYAGPTDTEMATIAFTRVNATNRSYQDPVQTEIIPVGSRIRAKLRSRLGDNSCSVKIYYHGYHDIVEV